MVFTKNVVLEEPEAGTLSQSSKMVNGGVPFSTYQTNSWQMEKYNKLILTMIDVLVLQLEKATNSLSQSIEVDCDSE